jgi:hypothetical protein
VEALHFGQATRARPLALQIPSILELDVGPLYCPTCGGALDPKQIGESYPRATSQLGGMNARPDRPRAGSNKLRIGLLWAHKNLMRAFEDRIFVPKPALGDPEHVAAQQS